MVQIFAFNIRTVQHSDVEHTLLCKEIFVSFDFSCDALVMALQYEIYEHFHHAYENYPYYINYASDDDPHDYRSIVL